MANNIEEQQMEQIKTYIINLPKDRDRRDSVLKEVKQFPCLNIEMLKAVYGKELSDEEKNRLFDSRKYVHYYGRPVLPGEIGCTLSHLQGYRCLLESDQQFALFLEDDVRFLKGVFTDGFTKAAIDFMNSPEPLVLLLHGDFNYIGKKTFFHDNYFSYRVYNALFTTAYLINKSAARLMLHKEHPYWVADDWNLFRRWGIRIFSLYPSAVIQQSDKFSSSIREAKSPEGRQRIFPHSWIECCLAYEKLVFLLGKRLGLIKRNHG